MTKTTNCFSIGEDPAFRALFDAIPCACMVHRMVFDDHGIPVDYVPFEPNPQFARALGFDPSLILGKRATEYLPSEEVRHWVSVFTPTALEGRTVSIAVYSSRKQASWRVTAISPERGFFMTMFSVDGNTRRDGNQDMIARWTDGRMSARDFIRVMFASMPCPAALHRIDRDGNGVPVDYTVVGVNGPFCDFLETTPDAMVGKNASSRMKPDEFRHWLDILAPIAFGSRRESAIRIGHRARGMFDGVAVSPEPGYVIVVFTN